jgi:diguanylate cyclase (GGDEF)-like protein
MDEGMRARDPDLGFIGRVLDQPVWTLAGVAMAAGTVIGLIAPDPVNRALILIAAIVTAGAALSRTIRYGRTVDRETFPVDPWHLLTAGLVIQLFAWAALPSATASVSSQELASPTLALTLFAVAAAIQLGGLAAIASLRARGGVLDTLVASVISVLAGTLLIWSIGLDFAVRNDAIDEVTGAVALLLLAVDVLLLVLARRPAVRRAALRHDIALFGAIGCQLAAHVAIAGSLFKDLTVDNSVLVGTAAATAMCWLITSLHHSVADTDRLVADPTSVQRAPLAVAGSALLLQLLVLVHVVFPKLIPSTVVTAVAGGSAMAGAGFLTWISYRRARGERAAYYDRLTGLPNQSLMNHRLESALDVARRTRGNVGVFFFDLDRFKHINDTMGHDAGDKLLRAVSKRVSDSLRQEDTLARWAGDEFVVILPDVNGPQGAAEIAQRLIDACNQAFTIDKREVFAGLSIGVALYPTDGTDPTSLMKNADAAMFLAKERGRRRFEMYSQEMSFQVQERLALEAALHTAIERDELDIYYQPKIDARTGRIVALEALLRWKHPDRGLVRPDEFIPIAEETGLIEAIGEWVLWRACNQLRAIEDAGLGQLSMAVNVSPRQFAADIDKLVERVIRKTGVDPSRLELEVTESLAKERGPDVTDTLLNLKALGVSLALDDFGTGYAALAYLTKWPIDHIKIDKSFVAALEQHDSDADVAVVDAVLALAKTLGLRTTAEGVETYEQAAMLREKGCDFLQGFVFSKPLDLASLERLLMLEVSEHGPIAASENRHILGAPGTPNATREHRTPLAPVVPLAPAPNRGPAATSPARPVAASADTSGDSRFAKSNRYRTLPRQTDS